MRQNNAGFGMALAIVVITILAIMVTSMVLFAGSQTGSMQNSLAARNARANAMAGLKAVVAKLKTDGRWYRAAGLTTNDSGIGVFGPGDIGLSPTDVNFVVVLADTSTENPTKDVTYNGIEFVSLSRLARIDLFSRGEAITPAGDKFYCSFYGRVILSPEPPYRGQSIKGIMEEWCNAGTYVDCNHTMIKLARVTDLNELIDDQRKKHSRDLAKIFTNPEDAAEERQTVREYVDGAKSDDFIANYGKVDWKANPAPPAGDKTSDGSALAYLQEFEKSPPANPSTQFMYDRIFDFLFDGNDPSAYGDRHKGRTIDLEKQPTDDSAKDFVQHACAAVGTPFQEPTSQEIFEPENALQELHSYRGASSTLTSTDYVSTLSYDPEAQYSYMVSWGATSAATNAAQAMSDTGVGGPWMHHGGLYYLGLAVDGPTPVQKPYWIRDNNADIGEHQYRIDDLANFWPKYYCGNNVHEPTQTGASGGDTGTVIATPGGGGGGTAPTGGGGSRGGTF